VIRVILHGLGGVGQKIANLVVEKPFLECVGAVTARSEDWGKDLGELLGLGKKLGIEVSSSLSEIIEVTKADAVLDATRSLVKDIQDFIFTSIRAGLNFVSVCEELAYPWVDSPQIAKEDAKLGFKAGDFITIDGDPKLAIEVKGFSDAAQLTANHAVNSIPYVIHARPGLLSPKDFPPFAPRV
jgi:hypothetical protein